MVYTILKVVIGSLLKVFFRIRVEGAENVPAAGGVILAANHQAFCDSLFLPASVRRRVTFVAKAEYFQQRKTAWFFRAVGQIPMNREGGDKSAQALGEALDLLTGGGILGIYPEGTRPADERLHKGRTGVARLALAAGCPVVPVGIIGTRAVQPIGKRMLRPFKTVTLRFGPAIDVPRRYGAAASDPLVLRQITDEVMFEIRELSGQEYVDAYASRSGHRAAGQGSAAQGSAVQLESSHSRERSSAFSQPW